MPSANSGAPPVARSRSDAAEPNRRQASASPARPFRHVGHGARPVNTYAKRADAHRHAGDQARRARGDDMIESIATALSAATTGSAAVLDERRGRERRPAQWRYVRATGNLVSASSRREPSPHQTETSRPLPRAPKPVAFAATLRAGAVSGWSVGDEQSYTSIANRGDQRYGRDPQPGDAPPSGGRQDPPNGRARANSSLDRTESWEPSPERFILKQSR
jgi:hypothetical protein